MTTMVDPRLTRPADDGSWAICCLCFSQVDRSQLEPVDGEPGKVWDVCRACAAAERAEVVRQMRGEEE
jgi:hypothetical protein